MKLIAAGQKPETDRAIVEEARACAGAMREYAKRLESTVTTETKNRAEARRLVESLTTGSHYEIYELLNDHGGREAFARFKAALIDAIAVALDRRVRVVPPEEAIAAIRMAKSFVESVAQKAPNERWPRLVLDGLAAVLTALA